MCECVPIGAFSTAVEVGRPHFLFVGAQEDGTPLTGEEDAGGVLVLRGGEVLQFDFVVMDEGECHGIDDDGAPFLHEVGGEGGVAVFHGVKEAKVRVQSLAAHCGVEVIHEECVAEA